MLSLFLNFSMFFCRTVIYADRENSFKETLKNVASFQAEKEDGMIIIEDNGRVLKIPKEEHGAVPDIVKFLKKTMNVPKEFAEIKENLAKIEGAGKRDLFQDMKDGKVSFVVIFSEVLKKFENERFKVIFSTDKELAKSLGVSFPGIYVFDAKENMQYELEFDNDYDKLTGILNAPLFQEVVGETMRYYEMSKLPVYYIFHDQEKPEQLKGLKDVARSFKAMAKVGLIPYRTDTPDFKPFGILQENLPAAVLFDNEKKYRILNLTSEILKDTELQRQKGALVEYISTGVPVNDNDERSVKIIVRSEWDKYHNDIAKDRLIVFESPRCGFCRQLIPTIDEMGDIIKENKLEDKVLIGRINIIENDMPEFKIKYFPTIALIKAKNNEVIYYESTDRTKAALFGFMKENGENGKELISLIENLPVEPEKDDAEKKPAIEEKPVIEEKPMMKEDL